MSETPPFGILVHSHLRWGFVWQRPQHILSRMAERVPVVFIEPPLPLPDGENVPRWERVRSEKNLTVVQPMAFPLTGDPVTDRPIHEKNAAAIRDLVDDLVVAQKWPGLVQWLYNPMEVQRVYRHSRLAVIYDCMDELANFKFAPPEIRSREAELMEIADVVFAGGPSLYSARRHRHQNIHQFNSGVDVAHFAAAQQDETVVPDEIRDLVHPVLLYYGVIDERMGWDNIAAICDRHPEWNVVMVGPLAKIGESDLLRRPNLHYTGQRGYQTLPGYLKGSDIALIPFAINEATEYLSPTKTLEYFAARKPVVSTPIQDIVRHYSDAARIADTPESFVDACEAALVASDENMRRLLRGEIYASEQTWDRIVEQMYRLVSRAAGEKG